MDAKNISHCVVKIVLEIRCNHKIEPFLMYWLLRMKDSLSSMREDFNDLLHHSIEKWQKM